MINLYFQKKRIEANAAKKKEAIVAKPKSKPKPRQFKMRKSMNTGIVYVGHIPHGFYEEQMEDYFKQFGKITRVRVARSKRVRIYLNGLIKIL